MVSPGDVDANYNFVHLFKGAFLCNTPYSSVMFDGNFDTILEVEVGDFQVFTALPVTGAGNFSTWCELLVSTGDENRKTKALDCLTEKVTQERAELFKSQGYETIGRYLTNEGGTLDENLTQEEISAIFSQEMGIFPIFQTYHHLSEHFTYENGRNDFSKAYYLALDTYGIPKGTCIYFPVDYDAYEYEVEGAIKDYFTGLNDVNIDLGNPYEIGIYGARNTCSIISNYNLAKYSFVSGMSIGFSGNLGYPLPDNWSFNQIYEDSSLGMEI